ncbi:MAG: nucleotide exchange factor GrpE [Epsilonproteobacteria bacterium]|nr:MAG: nucleotide exchange factor GrpE [Campylobacterota bacterium]
MRKKQFMTKKQFNEHISKKIELMDNEEIIQLSQYLNEETQEEQVAQELIIIKGEFKKLTKLVHSLREELKSTQATASKENLKPFIDLYSFLKNSEDALISMPENSLFGLSKFNRAFGAFENGFQTIGILYSDILNSVNLKLVAKEGDIFDANLHEAVEVIEDRGTEDGVIVEVLEDGFSHGDELLNYAKVKVNRWI